MASKKEKKEKKKQTLFFDACSLGTLEGIDQQLLAYPEYISIKDEEGYTALHVAVLASQLPVVSLLLTWGANPNALNNDRRTCLYYAVRSGNLAISKKLIERGAEPWIATNTNKTCLHAAVQAFSTSPKSSLQLVDLLLNKRAMIPSLLNSFINTEDSSGLTALAYAKSMHRQATKLHQALEKVPKPSSTPEINILLHGWNDNLSDWEGIEKNFTEEVNIPFFLFAYDSLADRISIGTLAEDLHVFIAQKLKEERKNHRPTMGSRGKSHVSVNLICYSTGGLIVRSFLKRHYLTDYRTIINRAIFLAPANMGSPFAKFGKSQLGKLYVGQKKIGSMFECGEELLTSLEPNSPFIWDLATQDVFEKEENQYFVPSEIMVTVIQGSKHYAKDLAHKVTRGDMRGTDGTVTISGASLRAIKYSMDLSGGAKGKEIHIEESTSDVALRLHPSHTHRSLIDSLVDKTDVFVLVRRILEQNREQFAEMQKSFKTENGVRYSPFHTPGNLMIFQCHDKEDPSIVPQVLLHKVNITPLLGEQLDLNTMKILRKASLVGTVREQFDYVEYHSRSRTMFYKIADFPAISESLLYIAKKHPGYHASLALTLKGKKEFGRIFASTAWLDQYDDCFYSSDIGRTSLFNIAPLLKASGDVAQDTIRVVEEQPLLEQSDNSTFVLKTLARDDCLDETLLHMGTAGILHLCSIFYRDAMLDSLLKLICFENAENLSGKTMAQLIRAFVSYFSVSTTVQEACVNLLIHADSHQMALFKEDMDLYHEGENPTIYENTPKPTYCRNLHQFVFTLLENVPFHLLKYDKNENLFADHLSCDKEDRGVPYIDLRAVAIATIATSSAGLEKEGAMKYLVFVEDTIQPECDGDVFGVYGEIPYPGVNAFLSCIANQDSADIVLVKSADYQKAILLDGVLFSLISYPSLDRVESTVLEYLSLYPEFSYSVIANNTPSLFTPVMNLLDAKSCVWCLLMDSGSETCDRFHSLEDHTLQHKISFGTTWVDAALNGYEVELLSPKEVIECSLRCLEDLQLGLTRKYIIGSATRWEHFICSVEEVKDMVTVMNNSVEKIACKCNADALHRSARENYVALLLSDTGIDMILNLKNWLDAQGQEAVVTAPKSNALVCMADANLEAKQNLRGLFPVSYDAPVVATGRRSNRTLSKTGSSLMSRARTISGNLDILDGESHPVPSYLRGVSATHKQLPAYLSQ